MIFFRKQLHYITSFPVNWLSIGEMLILGRNAEITERKKIVKFECDEMGLKGDIDFFLYAY